jgi:hypothetical protein
MPRHRGSLRSTKEIDATPSAAVARHRGRASDGGAAGMALRSPSDVKRQRLRKSIHTFPAEVLEMD